MTDENPISLDDQENQSSFEQVHSFETLQRKISNENGHHQEQSIDTEENQFNLNGNNDQLDFLPLDTSNLDQTKFVIFNKNQLFIQFSIDNNVNLVKTKFLHQNPLSNREEVLHHLIIQ